MSGHPSVPAAYESPDREHLGERCIHRLFEEQVARDPHATAIAFQRDRWSYGEVEAAGNQIANALIRAGLDMTQRVAIMLEKGPGQVEALLGVLKAGGVVVCLDANYPTKRLQGILEEAEPALLLTDDSCARRHQSLTHTSRARVLNVDAANGVRSCPASNPNVSTSPADPAYIAYTSGSTGRPKGIVQSHRSFCQFIEWQSRQFGVRAPQRFAQWASIAYDASYCEILGTLCFGATLCMATESIRYNPATLIEWARDQRITILQLVPSFCRQVVDFLEHEARPGKASPLPHLELLLLAGERLPVDLANAWLELFPAAKLYNLYGPSEAVLATYYPVEVVITEARSVPIGRAIDGREILILDDEQRPCPDGTVGEIYIRSRYLTLGYHAQPAETAKKFIQNPLHTDFDDPVYRTGDMGRWLPDGNIEFHGRRDDLVKLQGNRVELGDIEFVLRQFAGIKDGAVVVRTSHRQRRKLVAKERDPLERVVSERGHPRLVAYFTTAQPVSKAELRRFHEERLPSHMVPQHYVELRELPLNPNRKLDVHALPEPETVRPELEEPYVAPSSRVEVALAAIFEEVLGIEGVGANDGFFELGGDSLLAMQVLNRTRQVTRLELSYRDLFEKQTVANLAQLARAPSREVISRTPDGQPPLEGQPHLHRTTYPLSLAQEGVWFLSKLEPDSPYYTGQGSITLRGPLDVPVLIRAWTALLERHVVLRARFAMENRRPVQLFDEVRDEVRDRGLPVIDLRDLPEAERRRAMERMVRKKAQRALDLENDPLLDAQLFKLSEDEHELALTFHEIILDLWALSILIRDLATLYRGCLNGEESPLPRIDTSFSDYVVWERENVRRSALRDEESHWRRELSGDLPILNLPVDHPRPAVPTFRGASRHVMLDADLTASLRSLSARENATLFMTLLAAIKMLLRRYAGQDDIIVGAPIANRTQPSAEHLAGFFLNMLPLRTRFDEDYTFRELLRRMRGTVTTGITNGAFPFSWMLEALNVVRDRSVTPVFQVMFNMLNLPQLSLSEGDVEIDFTELDTGYTKYDLSFYAQEHGDRIFLEISYLVDLFDGATIERMLENLVALLRSIVADPEAPISRQDCLSDAERHAVISAINETDRDFENQLCIHELFERQVERTPSATAYLLGDERLSYAELNARANQLAHYLRRASIGREARVAVCTTRSFDMVIALVAVMKAGGTYVALDPEYPLLRLKDILRDVEPEILLLQSGVDRFQGENLRKVYIDTDWSRVEGESTDNPHSSTAPTDLLNIVYTSSTTGKPKGTLITQGAVLNRLFWMWERFPFRQGDMAVVQKSYALVAATWELFGGLLQGIPAVILSEEECLDPARQWKTLVKHRVTHLLATPAFLERLLDQAEVHPGELDSLRLATTSAEPIAPATVFRWRNAFPAVPLLNLYGATECASNVTVYDTRDLAADALRCPVGKPLANTRVYILDGDLRPLPIGATGEMCVSGACLARGYLNRPNLTAERFVPNPFSADSRVYRTGDLARICADGQLELVGRADGQVNVRGFRVELGDVEAALIQHEDVARCAVKMDSADGRGRLIAYIVARVEPPSASGLRRFLQERVPEYMIPADYVFLDALPLTPSGKVDRKKLPAPEHLRPELDVAFAAPATPIEDTLAQVWANVLDVERVGVYDNFFELGGHSLLATQVVYRLRDLLGVEIPLVCLFRSPTVADLAAEVEELRDKQSPHVRLPTIKPNPTERYHPFPLTDVQEAYWIGRSAAFELGNIATHFYAEVDSTNVDLERLQSAWRRVVERHDMLRAIVTADGRQRVLEAVRPYEIEVLDLRSSSHAAVERELAAVRDRMSHQILQADEWPLFEIRASHLNDRVRLHLSFDALTCDAFSKRLVFRDWGLLYENPETTLPPLQVTFRDYVLADAGLKDSDAYRRALEYWMARLDTLPAAPELPLAKDPSSVSDPHFVTRTARLDRKEWTRLKERATQAGLTPSGLALACFTEVLKQWSKNPRLAINMTLFNRLPMHEQVNDVVGDFTSLNLLAVDNSDCQTFEARARRLQEQLWDDLDHRYVTGVRVLRELAKRQKGAPRAQMPVVFTSVLAHNAALADQPMFWMGDVVHTSFQTPQVWLDHAVVEEAGELELIWTALDELFPEGLLEDMLGAYCGLLKRLAGDEHSWQGAWSDVAIELLPRAQREERAAMNATDGPVSEAFLHTLFASQVEQRADQPAVVTSERTLSYSELHRRANQVARRLRQSGVRPNTLVAVVMEKGWEQVVSVLGVLTSGAAYAPIDAGLPRERLDYLLRHTEADLVLTQSHLDGDVPWPHGTQRLRVDGEEVATIDDAPLDPIQEPDDLAYVIYTSGSTGLPKGVMIDHRGAVNTILDINGRFGVGPRDRVLALSSLSFDLSVWDIFGILAAGGTIVFPDPSGLRDPAHWADLVAREGITIWNSVPALMELLVDHASGRAVLSDPVLRLVMLSGDWIPVTLPDQIKALFRASQVVSLGGATEASIWSILYPIGEVDPHWSSIPYGRPMTNQRFHVLSEALEPCPVWVPGQLYIGGIGLAKGYWRDEDKTLASFITHPRTGERLYRTGDLGRVLPDGNIEFLGREDFQVKIQGHRIELGEIEAALLQHPSVRSAAVTAVGEKRGAKRLVAYVVSDEQSVLEMQSFLRQKLPEYMVPPVYVALPELPLTPNGKVDRQALPAPSEVGEELVDRPGEAASMVLRQIADSVASVLELEQVNPQDNLLYLGATSIGMIRIANRLDSELGFRPPMDAFYREPSVVGLSRLYEQAVAERRERSPTEEPTARASPDHALNSIGMLLDPDERNAFKLQQAGLRRGDHEKPSIQLVHSTPIDDVNRKYAARRSHRRFSAEPIGLARFSRLLGCLRQIRLEGEPKYLYASAGSSYSIQAYVYVKPDRIQGLSAGVYYYDPLDSRLVTLSENAVLDGSVYDLFVNRPVFDESAFAVYLIAQLDAIVPLYGDMSMHFATIEAGLISQLLETTACTCDIGLCQIGSLRFEEIRHLFRLDESHVLVHSLLGGGIDAEELEEGEV